MRLQEPARTEPGAAGTLDRVRADTLLTRGLVPVTTWGIRY